MPEDAIGSAAATAPATEPETAQTWFGACPHDCPDTCSMIHTTEGGTPTSARGNPDRPMTRSALCEDQGFRPPPLQPRPGPLPDAPQRSEGQRQVRAITRDEGLGEIHRRFTEVVETHGAEGILPYNDLGSEGVVQGLTVGDAFFNRLGATVAEKTFCGSGSCTAWLLTVGPTNGTDPMSFAQSRYIVIWGCNAISTNIHHWHVVKEAQRNGAKVVVIDPYRARTAKEADWHL